MHSPLFGIKSLGFSLGPLMANNDVEASRISDVDRDLKSRRELKKDREEFMKTRQSVGRDLPRTPVEEMEGYSHRRREINKGSYNQHCLGARTQHGRGNEVPLKQQIHQGSIFAAFSSIITEEKLPTFNGSSLKLDFLDWFDMFEDYFEAVNPPDSVKCKLVASKLKGEACIWWKELQNNRFSKGKNLITSWSRMRELLLKRFLHTSRLTYFYKQENEDSVKHTKCSTKFPNQLNKQEGAETIEYLQADGSIPPNCSTTGLLGVHRNSSLEENNVCEMVGDLYHTAEISRTEVCNKDNEYSEEKNERAKTIKHAEQEGADGIKYIHANKSTPAKCSIELPFESVNVKQQGMSELEIPDVFGIIYKEVDIEILKQSALEKPLIEEATYYIPFEAGSQLVDVVDRHGDNRDDEQTTLGKRADHCRLEEPHKEIPLVQLPKTIEHCVDNILEDGLGPRDMQEHDSQEVEELLLGHKMVLKECRQLPTNISMQPCMSERFLNASYMAVPSKHEDQHKVSRPKLIDRLSRVKNIFSEDNIQLTYVIPGEFMLANYHVAETGLLLFDPGGNSIFQKVRNRLFSNFGILFEDEASNERTILNIDHLESEADMPLIVVGKEFAFALLGPKGFGATYIASLIMRMDGDFESIVVAILAKFIAFEMLPAPYKSYGRDCHMMLKVKVDKRRYNQRENEVFDFHNDEVHYHVVLPVVWKSLKLEMLEWEHKSKNSCELHVCGPYTHVVMPLSAAKTLQEQLQLLKGNQERQEDNFGNTVSLIWSTTLDCVMLGKPTLMIRCGPIPHTITIILCWFHVTVVTPFIISVAELSLAARDEDGIIEETFTGQAREKWEDHHGSLVSLVHAFLILSLLLECVLGTNIIVSQWSARLNQNAVKALMQLFPVKTLNDFNKCPNIMMPSSTTSRFDFAIDFLISLVVTSNVVVEGKHRGLWVLRIWTTSGINNYKAMVEFLQKYGVISSKSSTRVIETFGMAFFELDDTPPYNHMQIRFYMTISASGQLATCFELLKKHALFVIHANAWDVGVQHDEELEGHWHCNLQRVYNLTRGRVIQWEGWKVGNDENIANMKRKLIMVDIIGIIMSSYVQEWTIKIKGVFEIVLQGCEWA